MENPPPGIPNPDDHDPTIDAINEVAGTMGGQQEAEPSIAERVEERTRALLDITNPANFPGIDEEILARNEELRGQVARYAALYESPDPVERAEARRFLLLVHDFSVAVHHGRANEFDEDSHERFLNQPFAPEEIRNGILGLLTMIEGFGADMVRDEYDLPPAGDREASLFEDDEHTLVAMILDTWIQFTDEIAERSRLMTPNHLIEPEAAEVRTAILEAALTHDNLATGTPVERISLVDRVLAKLPYALQAAITQQQVQRSNLQGEVEDL